jgi:hypothetical protein
MSGRAKKICLLVIALVLLAALVPIQRGLTRDRNRLGLTRQEPLENAPPVLAFTTVALGGFRGLIANALWIRAMDLQDEDKFFEMAQLADWITKLEPHYTQVWLVQGWNMAYNISVKFKETAPGEFPDRWRWVYGGIKLLRDEGLKYNPHDVLMFRELAWFFQHKMGQNLDDANMYYKMEWRKEMSRALGEKDVNWNELINPQTEEGRQRHQMLTNEFKLDPVFMKLVDDRYGPMEWRLPEAHAIYWASKGLDMATNYPEKVKKEDLVQLRRVVFQSMQASFRHGRLVPNDLTKRPEFGPNLEIIPKVNRAYEEAIEKEPEMRDNIKSAHRNFLRDAIYFLYTANRMEDASDWYRYLGEKYPFKALNEFQTNALPSTVTLGEFVLAHITEDVGETSQERVKALVEGFLNRALLFLAKGQPQQYEGWRLLAQALWKKYMDAIRTREAAIGLPTVDDTEREILRRMLDPKEGLPPEPRAILISHLPARLRPEESSSAPPASTNAPAATPTSP